MNHSYHHKLSANPNGKLMMLFRGKNFAGYYRTEVINGLTAKGYRVIVPDQIGFGKSSEPYIHYSFHLLSRFSRQLYVQIYERFIASLISNL